MPLVGGSGVGVAWRRATTGVPWWPRRGSTVGPKCGHVHLHLGEGVAYGAHQLSRSVSGRGGGRGNLSGDARGPVGGGVGVERRRYEGDRRNVGVVSPGEGPEVSHEGGELGPGVVIPPLGGWRDAAPIGGLMTEGPHVGPPEDGDAVDRGGEGRSRWVGEGGAHGDNEALDDHVGGEVFLRGDGGGVGDDEWVETVPEVEDATGAEVEGLGREDDGRGNWEGREVKFEPELKTEGKEG